MFCLAFKSGTTVLLQRLKDHEHHGRWNPSGFGSYASEY